jgi:hypothetical protein
MNTSQTGPNLNNPAAEAVIDLYYRFEKMTATQRQNIIDQLDAGSKQFPDRPNVQEYLANLKTAFESIYK